MPSHRRHLATLGASVNGIHTEHASNSASWEFSKMALSKLQAAPRKPETGPSVSDEELLARVAQQRDHDAFQGLFGRYAKPAYNLARYLTGSEVKAEDAVQEAMIQVWLRAKQFDSARGPARAWLLRIVANRTLASIRRRTGANKELSEVENSISAGNETPQIQFEHAEMVLALRSHLERLPQKVRYILALYFAGEMTQAEIAKALSMPQRTVCQRIHEGLAELRERLETAGFAATIPVICNKSIVAALLEVHDAPCGLFEGILARLSRVRKFSAPASATGGNAAVFCAGAVLLVSATFGGWWMLRTETSSNLPSAAEFEVNADPPLLKSQDLALSASLLNCDFNSRGDAARFMLVNRSRWHWISDGGQDGSGCMETDTRLFSVSLGVVPEELPVKVKLRYQVRMPRYDETGWSIWMRWSRHGGIADFWNIAPQNESPSIRPAPWMDAEILVTERFVMFESGVARHLFVHERKPGAQLLLGIQGKQRIDDLHIGKLDPKEIPDLSMYLDALAKIPSEQRKAEVPLREMACPVPGRQVVIHFYPEEVGVE